MKLTDKISMCLRNLWRRKARTMLTVIGVIIGTCAIIVMVSLGVGMDKAQQDMLEGMGNLTLINVYEGWDYEYREQMQASGRQLGDDPKLNYEALQKIKAIPHVKAATPLENMWGDEVVMQVDGRYRFQGAIYGIDFTAMPALGYVLGEGRYPVKAEYKDAVLICEQTEYQFIDTKRKRDNYVSPYPDEFGRVKDPFVNLKKDRLFCNIGDSETGGGMHRGGRGFYVEEEGDAIPTKYGSYPLKVLGTIKMEEGGIDRDFNIRSAIYMDVSRMRELAKEYNKKNKVRNSQESSYNQLYVMADSLDTVEGIEQAIKEMGYSPWSLSSQRKEMQKSTQTIQMILGGLAGISLLVAALGITNTMIMSIYERTREIGIMKVLGCVVGNIRSVFLMEAGCIGLLGGIIGVGLSYGISFGLNFIMNSASGEGGGGGMGMMGGMYGWSEGGMTQYSIIPPWLVAGALVFAICIGLVSGFYPANRAVKISALEAIKHE